MNHRIGLAAVGVAAGLASVVAVWPGGRPLQAQALSTPSFTAVQAARGKASYDAGCASCHGASLDDGAFAPPLKGNDFRLRWGNRPLDRLFDEMSRTMPPSAPNSLGDDTYLQLIAFLSQENGVVADASDLRSSALGTAMLPAAAGGPSGGLTTGVPPPAASAEGQSDRPYDARDRRHVEQPARG